MIHQDIIEIAKSYVGIKEIPENQGWDNKEFEQKMKQVGWQKGQAWCAYLGELIYKEAYAELPDLLVTLNKLFSANSQQMFRNFAHSHDWETGRYPKLGAIVVWKLGHTKGHTGIVTNFDDLVMYTVEGNAGNMVKERRRHYQEDNQILGYIYPKEV
jgi:hypothetical protein